MKHSVRFFAYTARLTSFGRIAAVMAATLSALATIAAPSVTTNSLVANTRYATEYFVHDSGVPGPTFFIVGGAHGNEPAGAAAAESIRHWPITKGKLVVIPRVNVLALQANKRLIPGLGSDLNNLNRNYPRAGKEEPARGEIAEAVWALAREFKPDWLLDLHEGFDFHRLNERSVGSSIIVFPNKAGLAAADLMLAAVNETISENNLKFVRRDMPVDGSLARAGGEHLGIPSMTLETTSKLPMEKRVRQHQIMVHRLFQHTGVMEEPLPPLMFASSVSSDTSHHNPVRVAIYQGPGTGGKGPVTLLKKLNAAPHSTIEPITPEQIAAGALTNFDVVIFGGGSGSKQAAALGENGREAVREFVGKGGGYIGICAGAYLATSGYPWSLRVINAKTVSPIWRRGVGDVKMELTDSGEEILGDRDGQFDVRYANGPIVIPANEESLPPYDALAYFRTELAKNGSPVGVMVDSPAIFSGQFKSGRVVCISPHPEQTVGLEEFVPRIVDWVAPKPEKLKAEIERIE